MIIGNHIAPRNPFVDDDDDDDNDSGGGSEDKRSHARENNGGKSSECRHCLTAASRRARRGKCNFHFSGFSSDEPFQAQCLSLTNQNHSFFQTILRSCALDSLGGGISSVCSERPSIDSCDNRSARALTHTSRTQHQQMRRSVCRCIVQCVHILSRSIFWRNFMPGEDIAWIIYHLDAIAFLLFSLFVRSFVFWGCVRSRHPLGPRAAGTTSDRRLIDACRSPTPRARVCVCVCIVQCDGKSQSNPR